VVPSGQKNGAFAPGWLLHELQDKWNLRIRQVVTVRRSPGKLNN
jgi:hypothetical protein